MTHEETKKVVLVLELLEEIIKSHPELFSTEELKLKVEVKTQEAINIVKGANQIPIEDDPFKSLMHGKI
jgi:hypothetical protein